MIHTFHIDDSSPNAKALLTFIKSLEFVKEVSSDLNSDQLQELEKRRSDRLNGNSKSYSWDEVKQFAKQK